MPDTKKIALKKIGAAGAGVGIVKSIQIGREYGDDYEDGCASVTIAFEKRDNKPAKKGEDRPYREVATARLDISEEKAKTLSIGQKVRVSIEPA